MATLLLKKYKKPKKMNNPFNSTKFSTELKKKRKKEKLTIKDASLIIGISPATLSRCENARIPEVNTFYLCCKWLKKKMNNYFFE